MGTRWWGLMGLAFCLLGSAGCGRGLHLTPPSPRTLTIVYSADVNGRVSGADGAGRNLSDVAARVDALRKEAVQQGGAVIVIDTGHAFSGPSPLAVWQRGSAVAQAMKAIGYDAVLPDEQDVWAGPAHLAQLQQAGGFQLLLGNAADATMQKPVVRTLGSTRLAIHGMLAPPHVFSSDEEGPAPDLALQRTPDGLLAAMRATPADVHVVVAGVRDPRTLLDKLPPNSIVIPAAGAPASAPDPRMAPALEGPRQLGRITVTIPAEGGAPRIESTLDAIPVGSTRPEVEAAVHDARQAFDKAMAGKFRDASTRVVGYAEPQGDPAEAGSAVADLVGDTLSADVVVLAPGEAMPVKGGVLSEAALARLTDPKARVGLVWASGAEVEGWLSQGGEAPAISGIAAWRDGQRRVVLALHEGRPLRDFPRLRVAVSTRLRPASGEAPRSLLEVVRTGVYARPYLGEAPPRWFSAESGKVPAVEALVDLGRAAAAEHPQEAESLWVQALYRRPDDETGRAVLAAMQAGAPDRFPSFLRLAEVASRAGQWQIAWNILQKGRIAWPAAAAYPLAQARLVILNGVPQCAGPLLSRAAELGAPSADVALLAGLQHLMMGDPAAADKSLRAALAEVDAADRTRYCALMGLAQLRSGDARGALTVWTRPAAVKAAAPVTVAPTPAASKPAPVSVDAGGIEVARP